MKLTAELEVQVFFMNFFIIIATVNNIGIPVIPFFDFGSSGGSLTNVDDGAAHADLPSPSLQFGSATFTTAFVSVSCCFLLYQNHADTFKCIINHIRSFTDQQ